MGLTDLFRNSFKRMPFLKASIVLSDGTTVEGYITTITTSTHTDEFGFSEEYDSIAYLPYNANVNAGDTITILNKNYIVVKLEEYFSGTEKVATKTYLKEYYG